MAATHRSLARTVAGYSVSRVCRHLFGVALAFLRPAILGPEFFGLWTMLKVIPTYAGYLHLGSRTGMRLELPAVLARNDDRFARRLRGAVLGLGLAAHLLAVAVLAVLALAAPWSAPARLGVAVMAAVILVQFGTDYLVANLKAEGRFDLIGAANYLQAGLSVAVAVPLLLLWRYYGLLAALLATSLAVFSFLAVRYRPAGRPCFDRAALARLLAVGVPVSLFQFGIALVLTCDRFLIAWLLDNHQLGLYGLALMLLALLGNLPGAAREVLEPALMAEADMAEAGSGGTHRVGQVRRYLVAPALPVAILLPYLLLLGAAFLPLALDLLLPAYRPAARACQVLLLGFYFLAFSHLPRTLVIAFHRQGVLLVCLLAILAANLAAGWFAIRAGLGIGGVALASAAAFALLAAAEMAVLWPWLGDPGRRLCLLAGLAGGGMVGAWAAAASLGEAPATLAGAAVRAAAGCGLYGALHLLFLRPLAAPLDPKHVS